MKDQTFNTLIFWGLLFACGLMAGGSYIEDIFFNPNMASKAGQVVVVVGAFVIVVINADLKGMRSWLDGPIVSAGLGTGTWMYRSALGLTTSAQDGQQVCFLAISISLTASLLGSLHRATRRY